ncbi:MAG: N-acetylmuramoyl-L-alanine amidase [Verrucomicrobiales bacterium]|jgi:N-acetylmuramoyl-L-alanine amidase
MTAPNRLITWASPLGLLILLTCLGREGDAQVVARPVTHPASWGDFSINGELMAEAGKHGRSRMNPMKPRYVTIHSTANVSKGADAKAHAKAIRNGTLKSTHNSLGFLTWHFTVDQGSVYQSLPERERGEHADYEGPGNRESIGIEMCVNAGNDANRTIDSTAKLTALLMKRHQIPLERVVPHQHWRRIRFDDRKDIGFKNCPGLLLENGKLAAKWKAFIAAIQRYHQQL